MTTGPASRSRLAEMLGLKIFQIPDDPSSIAWNVLQGIIARDHDAGERDTRKRPLIDARDAGHGFIVNTTRANLAGIFRLERWPGLLVPNGAVHSMNGDISIRGARNGDMALLAPLTMSAGPVDGWEITLFVFADRSALIGGHDPSTGLRGLFPEPMVLPTSFAGHLVGEPDIRSVRLELLRHDIGLSHRVQLNIRGPRDFSMPLASPAAQPLRAALLDDAIALARLVGRPDPTALSEALSLLGWIDDHLGKPGPAHLPRRLAGHETRRTIAEDAIGLVWGLIDGAAPLNRNGRPVRSQGIAVYTTHVPGTPGEIRLEGIKRQNPLQPLLDAIARAMLDAPCWSQVMAARTDRKGWPVAGPSGFQVLQKRFMNTERSAHEKIRLRAEAHRKALALGIAMTP